MQNSQMMGQEYSSATQLVQRKLTLSSDGVFPVIMLLPTSHTAEMMWWSSYLEGRSYGCLPFGVNGGPGFQILLNPLIIVILCHPVYLGNMASP